MSYFGLKTIREIERREREVGWWQGYADRLTPRERKRIAAGHYGPLKRELPPAIAPGTWLRVTARLFVHIAKVEPKYGKWYCRIDKVRDDRSYGGHWRPLHDPMLAQGDTRRVDPLTGRPWTVNPPEPERVDAEWLEKFRQDASRARDLSVRAAIMEKS